MMELSRIDYEAKEIIVGQALIITDLQKKIGYEKERYQELLDDKKALKREIEELKAALKEKGVEVVDD